MRKFKNFDNITEARDAYIWDTKPKTLEDAEDPEIMTNGFGRLGFSQLKDKLVKASKQFADWAKDNNCDGIEATARMGFWKWLQQDGYERSYVVYERSLKDE